MARMRACVKCGKPYEGTRCKDCVRQYDATVRNRMADAFYHSKEWRSLRDAVGRRDHYVCQMCEQPAGKSFHADHIVPREHGGADELENLQTLCRRCHSRKSLRETMGAPG